MLQTPSRSTQLGLVQEVTHQSFGGSTTLKCHTLTSLAEVGRLYPADIPRDHLPQETGTVHSTMRRRRCDSSVLTTQLSNGVVITLSQREHAVGQRTTSSTALAMRHTALTPTLLTLTHEPVLHRVCDCKIRCARAPTDWWAFLSGRDDCHSVLASQERVLAWHLLDPMNAHTGLAVSTLRAPSR